MKTNEKGEKIIEYPDGTWKLFVEEGTGDPLGVSQDEKNPWVEPDPEEEAKKKAIRYAELLSADAAQLQNFAQAARSKRLIMEEEMADMKARPNAYSSKEILALEHKMTKQKERESLSFSLYSQATRLAQDAENMIFLKPKKRDKAMKHLELEKSRFDTRMQALADLENPLQETSAPIVEKIYKTYDPQKDTRLNPPPYSCVFTHNEVDKFSGKMRRDLKPVVLLRIRPKICGLSFVTGNTSPAGDIWPISPMACSSFPWSFPSPPTMHRPLLEGFPTGVSSAFY
ncbi:MAG: hypothetical protein IPJ40_12375 [Saprospirales bacterium]|nr:hypothetical protein [Saprospirales bacterium]